VRVPVLNDLLRSQIDGSGGYPKQSSQIILKSFAKPGSKNCTLLKPLGFFDQILPLADNAQLAGIDAF